MTRQHGWNIGKAGYTAAALPLGMAIGAVSGGFISDRLFGGKRSTVIATSLLLCAASILILPTVTRWAGTGIGLMNAVAYAGAGVGTAVCGKLIDAFGYTAAFWFMAACAVLGAALIRLVREPETVGL